MFHSANGRDWTPFDRFAPFSAAFDDSRHGWATTGMAAAWFDGTRIRYTPDAGKTVTDLDVPRSGDMNLVLTALDGTGRIALYGAGPKVSTTLVSTEAGASWDETLVGVGVTDMAGAERRAETPASGADEPSHATSPSANAHDQTRKCTS